MKKSSAVVLIGVGAVAAGLLVLAVGGSPLQTHTATITLAPSGNRCVATATPEPLVVVSGDSVKWTLVNNCSSPPPHRQMRVKFHPPDPMDNCTLHEKVAANGGTHTLAACKVVHVVNYGDIENRKYDAEGGDDVLDPQLEIHGPENFLDWLRLKLGFRR